MSLRDEQVVGRAQAAEGHRYSDLLAVAQAILALRAEDGLDAFVWSFQPTTTPRPRTIAEVPTTSPESASLSKALRRKGFRFVGPTTMFALMEAVGIIDTHLVDSHRRGSSGIWSHPWPSPRSRHKSPRGQSGL